MILPTLADIASAALGRLRHLGDVAQGHLRAAQQFQHQQEKARTERAAVDLVRHPDAIQAAAGRLEAPAKFGKADGLANHFRLDVGHCSLLPLAFGHVPNLPPAVPVGTSYPPSQPVAHREQNGYSGVTEYGDVGGARVHSNPLHFLKRASARTLSVRQVMRMGESEAEIAFRQLRWPDTEGQAVCPYCGHDRCYDIRTRAIFKCAACRKTFSLTSGTIFHSAKLQLRDYLAIIALFVNAAKGISALQVSRDLGISYKSAFVILHKLREAIGDDRQNMRLAGAVEIDGAYYGGHVRPPNSGRQGHRPRTRLRKQCVLTMVARAGGTVAVVVDSENTQTVLRTTDLYLMPGSVVYADEHGSYDVLHALYEIHRINHRWEYSREGHICTNQAESFHSRMRRAEIGQHHHISGRYLQRYADEMAYRSDRRRLDNGAQFAEVAEMAISHPISRQWKGYWQKRA